MSCYSKCPELQENLILKAHDFQSLPLQTHRMTCFAHVLFLFGYMFRFNLICQVNFGKTWIDTTEILLKKSFGFKSVERIEISVYETWPDN